MEVPSSAFRAGAIAIETASVPPVCSNSRRVVFFTPISLYRSFLRVAIGYPILSCRFTRREGQIPANIRRGQGNLRTGFLAPEVE
jgi:hypothetical protein